MTPIAKLKDHRELGVSIQSDSIRATAKTAGGIDRRICKWEIDLIPLVNQFGDVAAAPFKPLNMLHPYEQLTVAGCTPLDDGFTLHRIEHAVRLSRLDKLFEKLPLAPPKGKGGNRSTYNDIHIVAKANAIREAKGIKSKRAAALEAMHRYPKLYEGRGSEDSIAKRIASQMK